MLAYFIINFNLSFQLETTDLDSQPIPCSCSINNTTLKVFVCSVQNHTQILIYTLKYFINIHLIQHRRKSIVFVPKEFLIFKFFLTGET